MSNKHATCTASMQFRKDRIVFAVPSLQESLQMFSGNKPTFHVTGIGDKHCNFTGDPVITMGNRSNQPRTGQMLAGSYPSYTHQSMVHECEGTTLQIRRNT